MQDTSAHGRMREIDRINVVNHSSEHLKKAEKSPTRTRPSWTELGLVTNRRVHGVLTSAWFGLALFAGFNADANGNYLNYMVAVSPDGSRVSVARAEKPLAWELFEGGLGKQPLAPVPMPAGARSTGGIVYSPDGKNLLFVTGASAKLDDRPPTGGRDTVLNGSPETLWRRNISSVSGSSSAKVFESPTSLTNVLPLLDGSIVFMGAVRRTESPESPLRQGRRSWSSYSWMLRKVDGSIALASPQSHAFFAAASLIRDEAVFFVEQRFVNRRAAIPPAFQANVTPLKPGADLSEIARLVDLGDQARQPTLACDWSGKTCIRTTAFTKNQYYAHQLEIFRDGKSCKVAGLPDRLERAVISRSGNAVVLITRPNPYRALGYQLAHFKVDANGCAGSVAFRSLP